MSKPMVRRTINYADKDQTRMIAREVELALKLSIPERMRNYYLCIKANYAIMGMDVDQMKVKRKIYYAKD